VRAVEVICEIPPLANAAQQTRQSVSGLALASECGGSDGYPGNSADPALGYAAVLLVRNGGAVALSETPEVCGCEYLLKGRAASVDVAEKSQSTLSPDFVFCTWPISSCGA
jgi:altronate dehydratase